MAYQKFERECLPVERKVPKSFSRDEWKLLSYEDKQDFVNRKKEAVLSGLQSRMGSPVVSIICDLQDLEARMVSQQLLDEERDEPLSKTYMDALKLKVELAKAVKSLTDKGVVKHEHVIKQVSNDDFVDVNFEEVISGAKDVTPDGDDDGKN